MLSFQKQKHYIIKFLVLLTIFFIFLYFTYQLTKYKSLKIVFNNPVSNSAKLEIENHLFEINLKKLKAPQILSKLKKRFNFLKSLEIRYNSSFTAKVKIVSYLPSIILEQKSLENLKGLENKKNYIFTQNGLLSSSDFFNKTSLDNLYKIHIEPTELNKLKNLTKKEIIKLYSILVSIDNYTFKNYKISWFSDSKIILNSLAHKNFSVIADSKTVNQFNKILSAEKIYQAKIDKNSSISKKNITLDIRFRDLIISSA